MRKDYFICVGLVLILIAVAGCEKQSAVISDEMPTLRITAEATPTADPIDVKVTEALDKIDDAVATALNQIQSAVPVTATPVLTATEKPTATQMLEPVSADINIVQETDDLVVTIKSASISYQYGNISFEYAAKIKEPDKIKQLQYTRVNDQTVLIDKNGKQSHCAGYSSQQMYFDFQKDADLSRITINFTFDYGYDPVTVTFDIPGI